MEFEFLVLKCCLNNAVGVESKVLKTINIHYHHALLSVLCVFLIWNHFLTFIYIKCIHWGKKKQVKWKCSHAYSRTRLFFFKKRFQKLLTRQKTTHMWFQAFVMAYWGAAATLISRPPDPPLGSWKFSLSCVVLQINKAAASGAQMRVLLSAFTRLSRQPGQIKVRPSRELLPCNYSN